MGGRDMSRPYIAFEGGGADAAGNFRGGAQHFGLPRVLS